MAFSLDAKPWLEGHGELSYAFIIPLRGWLADWAIDFVKTQLTMLLKKVPEVIQEKVREHLGMSEQEWDRLLE